MKLADTNYWGVGDISIMAFSTTFLFPVSFSLSLSDTQTIPLDFYVSRNRDGLRNIMEYQYFLKAI